MSTPTPRSLLRKAGRIMLILLAVPLTLLLILAAVLLASSPGKPVPLADAAGQPIPGSLSEKIWVDINGVPQGMIIKSANPANPVLLFLHGGPGMPEYFLTQRYPTRLEQHFTVVWWDQRGAGLSYRPGMPPTEITIDQLIADTLAVTDYLRNRFGQDKIYLMAHSGGSFIGLQAAALAPQRYHAYIGIAQITYQLQSEQLAYEYMLAEYKAAGNTRMVSRLEAAPPAPTGPLPAAYNALRDDAMHGAGVGTTRAMRSVITGVFLPSWFHPEYTLPEKLNLWRGKFFSKAILWDGMVTTDLAGQVPALELPAYFLHGRHDYTVAYPLAQAYVKTLQAPLKGFYTFEDSAHSPMFEEPEKLEQILLQDVLQSQTTLADQE